MYKQENRGLTSSEVAIVNENAPGHARMRACMYVGIGKHTLRYSVYPCSTLGNTVGTTWANGYGLSYLTTSLSARFHATCKRFEKHRTRRKA